MIWNVCRQDPRLQSLLSGDLGVTPWMAQLLVNRGIRTSSGARDFLFGDISSCPDPLLMKDMEKAADRIRNAAARGEKILVYGDYDVDGVSSVAIMSKVLRKMGARFETFIPDRIEDGYGLNLKAVDTARADGIDLIVTVDCGINSAEEVKRAGSYGIDTVITDHHEVKGGDPPPAYAIVDPHQEDCGYPFKFLAGVGVAYKLSRVLMKGEEEFVDSHLDLVALGTVADVVPQTGENRMLTREGLKRMRKTQRPGLKALMDVARVEPDRLSCRSIGFALGPRINAMGRVGSAEVSLRLLMSEEHEDALRMARELDRENRNRQHIEKAILKDALRRVGDEVDLSRENIIVLADDGWHPGVIGIAASRLTEEYSRPAILIALKDGQGKGSGRSVEGFNLFEAIEGAADSLIDFGGHEQACGVRIQEEAVAAFRDKINETASLILPSGERPRRELGVDLTLPFSQVGLKLINELNLLMPYGPGNNEPVFSTYGIKVKTRPRDIGRNGFKFLATCGNMTCEAVTFRGGSVERPSPGDMIDLAYTPSINSWGGIDTIQLNIKDLKRSDR